MVPLYAARVCDLQTGDFVRVECACGHEELIAALTLTRGFGSRQMIGSSISLLGSGSGNVIRGGTWWCR
jgi:hypothetical protein